LQYHREGGDVEGNHRKKHEERIWQQLVHGKEISLDIRKEGTAKSYPQSPFGIMRDIGPWSNISVNKQTRRLAAAS